MPRTSRHCNRLPALVRVAPPQAKIPDFIASSLVPARAGLSGSAAVKRMASDMREAAYREGGLTQDGMELLGWTPAQIAAMAGDARVLANQQAVLT